MARFVKEFIDGDSPRWNIVDRDTGEVVGVVGKPPRYFISEYTDGPATRWNVIDRRTQELVRRFATKAEAEGYTRKLNLRGEDFVFLGSGH